MTAVAAEPLDTLPTVVQTLERCIAKGMTRSAQVAVRYRGEPLVSGALGTTSLGREATVSTAYLWSCASKPLVSVVLGMLVDQGVLTFGDTVGRYMPELRGPVGQISLTELLTHTAGLGDVGAQAYFPPGRDPDRGDATASLHEIAESKRDPAIRLGRGASYSVFSNWFLLSEVIERVTGSPCAEIIAESILEPLHVWARLWMTVDEVRELDRAPFQMTWEDVASRILQRADQADGPCPEEGSEILDGTSAHLYSPGSSCVGPIASLVAILDGVMADAVHGMEVLLSPETARQLVSPHRVGVVDNVMGNDLTWGLGVTVDQRAFSPRVSSRAFGHLGWDSTSIVFADPLHDITVGIAFDRQLHGLDSVLRHGAVVGALVADMQDMGVL